MSREMHERSADDARHDIASGIERGREGRREEMFLVLVEGVSWC